MRSIILLLILAASTMGQGSFRNELAPKAKQDTVAAPATELFSKPASLDESNLPPQQIQEIKRL